MTTDNEQPKSAEEIRPKELAKEIFDLTEELRIKAKILRLEKEDDLIDYWEKRIESSAQQRIKELEEQVEYNKGLYEDGIQIIDELVKQEQEAHNKAVQECIDTYVKNTLDTNPVYSGLISQFEKLKKR